MDKNKLLDTAKELKQVEKFVFDEYQYKAGQIVSQVNKKMLQRPDIRALVGENNLVMLKDNHANHVRFIASILKNYNPDVLVDTVLWVFRAYRTHGFQLNYWPALLNLFIEILKENLSPESYREILPYYTWMQVNIPTFVQLSDEKLNP